MSTTHVSTRANATTPPHATRGHAHPPIRLPTNEAGETGFLRRGGSDASLSTAAVEVETEDFERRKRARTADPGIKAIPGAH